MKLNRIIIAALLAFCFSAAKAQPVAYFGFSVHCSTVTFFDYSSVNSGLDTIVSWLWDFGDSTTSTLQNPVHTYPIASQSYTVTLIVETNTGVRDTAVLLAQGSEPHFNIYTPDYTICRGDTTTITVTQTFGVSPFSYQWSTGDTTQDITVSPFGSGPFTLTVTDGNGCTNSKSLYITVLQRPSIVINPYGVFKCPGDTTFLTATSAPWDYLWSTGDTLYRIPVSPIVTTTYTLTATDHNGCSSTSSVPVNVRPRATLTLSPDSASLCPGESVQIKVIADTSALFTYLWSNGVSADSILVTTPGTYAVTVSASQWCDAIDSMTVLATSLNPSFTAASSTCGNNDGSATITVNGGTPPYTYGWNTVPVQQGATATGLIAGNYEVTVSDSAGCIELVHVNVSDAGGPSLSAIISSAACSAATNGAIDLTVTGGAGACIFDWSNGATTEDLTNLSAGAYSVVVTDTNGCIASNTITVPVDPMTLTVTTTSAGCVASTGTATVHAANAISPTYKWSNGQSTATAVNLAPGWYSVTVTSAGVCQRHVNVYVDEPANCYVTISGTVYFDLDNDCVQDSAELGIPNILVDFEPGGAVFTRPNGEYSFVADAGTYSVKALNNALNVACPPSGEHTVSLNNGGDVSANNDFAIEFDSLQDLAVTLACGPARPGFQQNISFSVTNWGNFYAVGYLEFALDSHLTYANFIPPADTIIGNTAVFNLALVPRAYRSFTVQALVSALLPIGTPVAHSVSAYPDSADIRPADNSALCERAVTNAYDPNAKEVSPEGTLPEGTITQDDTLMHYTIFFQNTGNDTAFTVVIKDTLDSDLDYKTFKQGTASHPCSISFEQDHVVVFTFENILLPDSNINEPMSHGHVSYYVEHNGKLPYQTVITNRAAIYFDYNAPIITNTATNKIFDPTGIGQVFSLAGSIRIYPNPAQDAITVERTNSVFTQVFISDLVGRRVYDSGRISSVKHLVNLNQLNQGMYIVSVVTADGIGTKKVLIE